MPEQNKYDKPLIISGKPIPNGTDGGKAVSRPGLRKAVFRLRAVLCLFFFSLSMLCCPLSLAQNYPVTVTTMFTPPYSLRLSDYTTPGSQRLVIQIVVNDLNISNLPVKLHIKMESVGITVETPVSIAVVPIYLNGGQVHVLFGEDLAEYFNINNLQFKGYSKETYRRTGQLPDGFWRISAEVVHFGAGRPLSNTGSVAAWIATGKPPQLRSPENGAEMGQNPGMPLVFTWLPVNTGIPMFGGNVQYNFEMWEIRIPGIDPYVATAAMPVFYSATQPAGTSHIVQTSALLMEPGMTYAWRVTAFDPAGFIPFENDGHSEVRTFTYQSRCDSVKNFSSSVQLRRGTFQWQNAPNHTSFNVELRNPTNGWQSSSEAFDNKVVYNDLDYGSVYQMRVQAVCNADPQQTSDFTGWQTIRIAEPKPKTEADCPDCECKDPDDAMPELTNFTLRKDLQPGDTLIDRRGTTRFIVKSVTPQSDGVYKGIFLFWAEIWRLKFICEYWDLSVNTDNVIVNMDFESVYDPTFVMDAEEIKEKINELAETINDLAYTDNVDVTVDYEIANANSFSVDSLGNIVVMDTDGNTHIVVAAENVTEEQIDSMNAGANNLMNGISAGQESSSSNLEEVIIEGLSSSYEIVVNGETEKTTTDKKLKLVYEQQKLILKLQKNNGDTINVANIQWEIGKEVVDSTLTKEITIADKNVDVIIYEKVNEKGKTKKAIIAKLQFIVKQSPYVTLSTLSGYDGEFGFDDGEDFADNSIPKQGHQYENIQIAEAKNKTKTLYVPWLTLLQGQTAIFKADISNSVDGDSLYVETSNGIIANYDKAQRRITITNNSLNNDFAKPAYINFYRDDKYGLQKRMLIGRCAVVSKQQFKPIDVQIVYFASDTTRIKSTVNATRLQTLLNSNSLNQSFAQFTVLPNIIRIKGSSNLPYLEAYNAIRKICRGNGMRIVYSTHPTTIYVVLTDLAYKVSEGNDGKEKYRGGGVAYDEGSGLHNNFAVMWLVENSTEDKEKTIIHEIGHTLGLRDAFNETELGTQSQGFSRHNYMDYNIIRKMFFRKQIEIIMNNLKEEDGK